METRVCKTCGRGLPIENFSKNAYGYIGICKECNSKHRSEAAVNRKNNKRKALEQELLNAKNLRLSDFTPRELMEELKRRGYEGQLTYVETHTIDLSKI